MGSHHAANPASHVWLTPPWIMEALGPFDLDPCAAPAPRPWPTAAVHVGLPDDGLRATWDVLEGTCGCEAGNGAAEAPASAARAAWCKGCGRRVAADGRAARIWMNPPYALIAYSWLERLARHGRGTALVFARTETAGFFDHVWDKAAGLLFLEGRLHFHHADGRRAAMNGGAPSVLVAYGEEDASILHGAMLPGKFVGLGPRLLAAMAIEAMAGRAQAGETWRQAVARIMLELGGTASLAQIYERANRHPKTLNNREWRAKVRQTIARMQLERTGAGTYRQKRDGQGPRPTPRPATRRAA